MLVSATPNVIYLFACNAVSSGKCSSRFEVLWLFLQGVTSRDTWLFLITAMRTITLACWTALLKSLQTFQCLLVHPASAYFITTKPLIFNPLTPNDHYSGRTAPLTSKRCILYIYSTNIGTGYFKHGIYSSFFSLQNAVCFIILTYLVPELFTFYVQGVLKLKNIIPAPKG